MRETAYAKINLALHVRGREPDGYHRLETLFAFAGDGDALSAAPADRLSLTITGPFAAGLSTGGDNLVLRAADALLRATGDARGAAIRLDKRLPVASGIGGGSADAAAALRLLVRLWGVQPGEGMLHDIAAKLGADVPACLASRTVRGDGRGDRLEDVDGSALSGASVLLVNPGAALSTASVFRAWDGVDRGPLGVEVADAIGPEARNDLEAPARGLVPAVGDVLDALRRTTPTLARMSGSGATCFALYPTRAARDDAERTIAALHPGWWRLATCLR